MVAGHHPSPRSLNPEIPDGVLEIVRTALQRDPARRYATAAEMGAACEHFLYDKGYGPTNLTLKEYVGGLFPGAAPAAPEDEDAFPAVAPTELPIFDESASTRAFDADATPPSAVRHDYTVALSRSRRIKTRTRNR